MRAFVLTLFLMLGFGIFQTIEAQTDRPVKIRINQEKTVAGKLAIKFVSVEDSRCPKGTQCIWAGNAKVVVKVRNGRGAARTMELNTGMEPQNLKFAGYEIKLLEVSPEPADNIRINRNGYTAKFSVTKL